MMKSINRFLIEQGYTANDENITIAKMVELVDKWQEEKQVKNIAYEPVLAVVDCEHDWQAIFKGSKHIGDYCDGCDTFREL